MRITRQELRWLAGLDEAKTEPVWLRVLNFVDRPILGCRVEALCDFVHECMDHIGVEKKPLTVKYVARTAWWALFEREPWETD